MNLFIVSYRWHHELCLILSHDMCVFKNNIFYYELCGELRLYDKNHKIKFILDVKEII